MPVLNAAERDVITRSFEYFDTDGNGQIDLSEFMDLTKRLGIRKPDAIIEHAFASMDTNSRGFIDFKQFCVWWQGFATTQVTVTTQPD